MSISVSIIGLLKFLSGTLYKYSLLSLTHTHLSIVTQSVDALTSYHLRAVSSREMAFTVSSLKMDSPGSRRPRVRY